MGGRPGIVVGGDKFAGEAGEGVDEGEVGEVRRREERPRQRQSPPLKGEESERGGHLGDRRRVSPLLQIENPESNYN